MMEVDEAEEDTLVSEGAQSAGYGQRALAYARAEPLAANAILFAAGFFLMPNGWLQLCGLLGMLMLQSRESNRVPDLLQGLREDGWLKAVLVYLIAGVAGSLLVNPAEASVVSLIRWTGGGALLVLFLLVFWQVGRSPEAGRLMGKAVALAGAIAGVGSVVVFYFLMPDGLIGDRLQNWFVYGGLHPVCAGLMWGFAATWAAIRWNDAEDEAERSWWFKVLLILLVVTLLTLSRGALLALGMGHAAMFVYRGWRRAWRPCALLAGMVLAFQLSAPVLTKVADLQERWKIGTMIGRDQTREKTGAVVVTHNPVKELCQRGDNGRLQLYRNVLATMTTPTDWLFGKGLWASDAPWRKGMTWVPEHVHSVFMSTLFHHGALGLAALLALLGWGMWRCLVAARAGQDMWLILACYGTMALVFDGHSMQTLVSLPRFEVLVLWLPLAMGCAASRSRQT